MKKSDSALGFEYGRELEEVKREVNLTKQLVVEAKWKFGMEGAVGEAGVLVEAKRKFEMVGAVGEAGIAVQSWAAEKGITLLLGMSSKESLEAQNMALPEDPFSQMIGVMLVVRFDDLINPLT